MKKEGFSLNCQSKNQKLVLALFCLTTIVSILTFMSGKNSTLCISEPEKMLNFLIFLYL